METQFLPPAVKTGSSSARQTLWLLMLTGTITAAAAAPRSVIHRDRVVPHWFAGPDRQTNQLWYAVERPDGGHEFIHVDAAAGRREPAFDAARVAAALQKLTGQKVEANHLPVQELNYSPDGQTLTLSGLEGGWRLNLADYTLTALAESDLSGELLPVEAATHPSGGSEVETKVEFVNRLKTSVKLYWIDPQGHRIAYGAVAPGERYQQNTYAGHVWLVTAGEGAQVAVFTAQTVPKLAVVDGRPPAARHREGRGVARRHPPSTPADVASPDHKWSVFARGDNLFLRAAGATNETQLTFDGCGTNSYARHDEFASGMDLADDRNSSAKPEVYWAPDSRHFVAIRHRPGTNRLLHLIESSPAGQVQPKEITVPYLKPGDVVPVNEPHLFAVTPPAEVAVSHDLFPNPWSNGDFRWEPDSSRFTFLYNQRGHQVLRLLAVDAASGAVTATVSETSRTFIDYSGKYFCEPVEEAGELIWMSERDGWNHLYLYDAQSGSVKNQITKGEWVVREVQRVDHEHRQIWFTAGGLVPGQDPYYLHNCRVNFDGTGLTDLTPADGTHQVEFSPDNAYLLDTWSRVDAPPVTELRRTRDGSLVCGLETAEVTGRARLPQPFHAKGRDGVTEIYGVLWRPRDFDPHKQYAVIEDIYAGPQDSFTPKAFRLGGKQQELADQGYIVVQMDGMGTCNRSKAFHDVCWKNLRDAGFPDRIRWIRAAARQFPELDLTRVGIYGTSAGGQDALWGVLDHGDFYRAGVADSGCYDNRMDKIWWNEQWMGWPVDDSYAKSSCVTAAGQLNPPLLLLAGELDQNVDPSSTMQVVNALVKANKDFELFIMPGMGHGVLGTAYGWRRLEEFFARHLGPPR